MQKFIIIFFLLSSCSITQKKEFLVNVTGTYSYKENTNTITFDISSNGAFIYNDTIYTFKEAITPTNAIYQLDDVQYAGIILDTSKNSLKQILSTNTSYSGIIWTNNKSIKFIGQKETPKIITK